MHLIFPARLAHRAAAAALACLLLAGCSRPAVLQPSSSQPEGDSSSAASAVSESQPARFAIAVSEGNYNPYLNTNTLTEQVAGLVLKSWSASPPGWSWKCGWLNRSCPAGTR